MQYAKIVRLKFTLPPELPLTAAHCILFILRLEQLLAVSSVSPAATKGVLVFTPWTARRSRISGPGSTFLINGFKSIAPLTELTINVPCFKNGSYKVSDKLEL